MQPNYTAYKIFIVDEEKPRLDELMNTFKDIESRILSVRKGKFFSRVIVELYDEEVAVLKLALRTDEYLITDILVVNKDTALFDAHVEMKDLD